MSTEVPKKPPMGGGATLKRSAPKPPPAVAAKSAKKPAQKPVTGPTRSAPKAAARPPGTAGGGEETASRGAAAPRAAAPKAAPRMDAPTRAAETDVDAAVKPAKTLAVEIDGVALPDEDAIAVWRRFSEWMEEKNDLKGFAAEEGVAAVKPTVKNGRPTLLVTN